ncbi:hypothetical protein MTO96_026662 [Rhipicephalus appendiculatus]
MAMAMATQCSQELAVNSNFEQKGQDGLKKLRPDAVPTVFPLRAALKQPKPPETYSSPVQPPCHADPAAVLQDLPASAASGTAPLQLPASCMPSDIPAVVLSLAEELLNLRGYKYHLTSRLIQDCLENIFSIVRMKKPVPSAYDVKSALKLICVGQFLHTPKSSSYDSDDGLHLAELLGPSLGKSLKEFRDDEDHLENLLLDEVSSVECDILAYVGGFLLEAIIKAIGECTPCIAVLLGDGQCYNTLIELKEYVKGATNLLRPSAAVTDLLIRHEEHFKGFVSEDAILDLKAPFRTISKLLATNLEIHLQLCIIHREKVQKLLLERFVVPECDIRRASCGEIFPRLPLSRSEVNAVDDADVLHVPHGADVFNMWHLSGEPTVPPFL